jgi:hypothetical protein
VGSHVVHVTFTSDPPKATLSVNGAPRGTTPITVTVPPGVKTNYRVVAPEPYTEYNLYKPYNGTATASKDENISVWIPRTTAAEQQAAIKAAAEKRAAAKQAAEEEACDQARSSASLVVENWRWGAPSVYFYKVEGLVKNWSGQALDGLQAEVRFYDSNGEFISSDSSFVDAQPLLAGQSSPFSILANYNTKFKKAELSFRTFDGRMVTSIRKTDLPKSCLG